MLFNSVLFLVYFPLVTTLFYLTPKSKRWATTLIASCVFYMALVPVYILVLFAAILIDYYAGLVIDRSSNPAVKKRVLIASVLSTCLILFVFKYYNFFIYNFHSVASLIGWNLPLKLLDILLPVGLSFHTFQSLSYVIEVYRGNQKAERHLGIYAVYVMFYPQLVAGPIERPQNLLHQFHEPKDFDPDNLISGLKLMLWGFFKKVVIADRLAALVGQVYTNPSNYSGATIALSTVFFAFQIYCDFSGYSDIARGAAETLGVKLMINFDRPYLSQSVSEFWRRWHISLSTWFRDYLYITLGGSRCSKPRYYFNLFVTFLISGFWHGASWNFVIWGGLNGLYLVMALVRGEKKKSGELSESLSIISTFFLICLTWVFFRAADLKQAMLVLRRIFFDFGTGDLKLNRSEVMLSLVLIFALYVLEALQKNADFRFLVSKFRPTQRAFVYLSILASIVLIGVFKQEQFIYFQF